MRLHGGGRNRQHESNPNGDDKRLHASPPARSASGGLERDPGLRPSTPLYHVITQAAAIIRRIPNTLTTMSAQAPPPAISAMKKWPAKAKNTPKQKICRECWPHRMAGRRIGDLSPGQSRGT